MVSSKAVNLAVAAVVFATLGSVSATPVPQDVELAARGKLTSMAVHAVTAAGKSVYKDLKSREDFADFSERDVDDIVQRELLEGLDARGKLTNMAFDAVKAAGKSVYKDLKSRGFTDISERDVENIIQRELFGDVEARGKLTNMAVNAAKAAGKSVYKDLKSRELLEDLEARGKLTNMAVNAAKAAGKSVYKDLKSRELPEDFIEISERDVDSDISQRELLEELETRGKLTNMAVNAVKAAGKSVYKDLKSREDLADLSERDVDEIFQREILEGLETRGKLTNMAVNAAKAAGKSVYKDLKNREVFASLTERDVDDIIHRELLEDVEARGKLTNMAVNAVKAAGKSVYKDLKSREAEELVARGKITNMAFDAVKAAGKSIYKDLKNREEFEALIAARDFEGMDQLD